MRPVVPLRWLACVVALGFLVAGGVFCVGGRRPASSVEPSATSPASDSVSVADAVRRTLAARSARVTARYVRSSGPPVDVEGVTSFDGPESEMSASIGSGEGVVDEPARVRITAEGAWVQPPGALGWTAVNPAQVALAAEARGWADLLRRLEPAGHEASRRGLRASLDGSPVRLWLDARRRIARIRLVRPEHGDTLDLRFSDFGIEVHVVSP